MDHFRWFDMWKQGAEAKLRLGTLFQKQVVLKERFVKKYRHPLLDQRLTKERTKAEIRALMRCKAIGVRTPTIFFADPDSGILIMEHLVGAVTCREFIQDQLQKPLDKSRKTLSMLSTDIGHMLSRLHRHGIIHGDFTTSNILVQNSDPDNKLCIIDFGLGFAEGTPEDKGVDLYVLERALISTHPNAEFMFEAILESYQKDNVECDDVIRKFHEIRQRGRKRDMIG